MLLFLLLALGSAEIVRVGDIGINFIGFCGDDCLLFANNSVYYSLDFGRSMTWLTSSYTKYGGYTRYDYQTNFRLFSDELEQEYRFISLSKSIFLNGLTRYPELAGVDRYYGERQYAFKNGSFECLYYCRDTRYFPLPTSLVFGMGFRYGSLNFGITNNKLWANDGYRVTYYNFTAFGGIDAISGTQFGGLDDKNVRVVAIGPSIMVIRTDSNDIRHFVMTEIPSPVNFTAVYAFGNTTLFFRGTEMWLMMEELPTTTLVPLGDGISSLGSPEKRYRFGHFMNGLFSADLYLKSWLNRNETARTFDGIAELKRLRPVKIGNSYRVLGGIKKYNRRYLRQSEINAILIRVLQQLKFD